MAGSLQDAIALIKQGNKREARAALEGLLRANPQDVTAWFWYAESLETPEKRLKALELCKKVNPDNPQVDKALAVLRARMPAAPPAPAPAARQAFQWDDEPPAASKPAFQWDDEPVQPKQSAIQWDDDEPAQPASKPAFDWDAIEKDEAAKSPQPQFKTPAFTEEPEARRAAPKRSFPFYQAWATALFNQKLSAYEEILDDPEAGAGRAIEWTLYVSVISGALVAFALAAMLESLSSLPELRTLMNQVYRDLPKMTLLIYILAGGIVVTPISAVINLAYLSGLQNLVAKMNNGRGNFGRTMYALAAYQIPLQILMGLLVIPILFFSIGSINTAASSTPPGGMIFLYCLFPVLAIYSLVLNVRALQAAHNMGIGGAIVVLVITVIAQAVISCCLNFMLQSTLLTLLPVDPSSLPTY
jgi:hypothetical protein